MRYKTLYNPKLEKPYIKPLFRKAHAVKPADPYLTPAIEFSSKTRFFLRGIILAESGYNAPLPGGVPVTAQTAEHATLTHVLAKPHVAGLTNRGAPMVRGGCGTASRSNASTLYTVLTTYVK